MSKGILGVIRALLTTFLLSALCLFLLCAFAYTREAPEELVTGCGRATLFFAALIAGFLGAKNSGHLLSGVITTATLLVLVLLLAALFPSAAQPAEQWIFLGFALACGVLGSLLGSKRRTKVVRRNRRTHRG